MMNQRPDLRALDDCPGEMKARLLKLIDSNSSFFIITGSDPRDLKGCCPSDGVKAANRLVEAGILQVVRRKTVRTSCPVNIYAFSGEIKSGKEKPEFRTDPDFRRRVKGYLIRGSREQKAWITVLRWGLLAFTAVSLIVFAVNFWKHHVTAGDLAALNLTEEFDLPFTKGLLILQFHRTQRCDFCLKMEHHTRETLDTYFKEDIRSGRLAFRTVDMEKDKYKALSKNFDLFTSTLVLVDVVETREFRWKIVTKAWRLTNNVRKFMDMLRDEVNHFLEGRE